MTDLEKTMVLALTATKGSRKPYTVRPFLSGVTSFPTADEAKAAAQSDFETRIRSALVSGSREDGA